MDRNEAILVLLSIKHFFKMDTAEDEALDMAIAALEGKDIGCDSTLAACYDVLAVILDLKPRSEYIERIERGVYPKGEENG